MASDVKRMGGAATAAGALMVVGVEGEWLFDPQADDGSVTNLPVFALLMLTATIGFALLFLAALRLRALSPTTRSARTGALLTLVGAGLLVIFGTTGLVTALVTGSPLEASFIAFLLGMLLLAVGPISWGLSLRRHSPAPGLWQMLAVSGAAALAALALEADPWHDVALVTSYGAWTAIGLLLLRHEAGAASAVPERAGRA